MTETCTLQVTQQEYDDIRKCEAVIVREYESQDGTHFAVPMAWGDLAEMEEQATAPGVAILPAGVSIVSQQVVPVADLLGQ